MFKCPEDKTGNHNNLGIVTSQFAKRGNKTGNEFKQILEENSHKLKTFHK